MMDCLYIVIPAYNESENILEVINDWYSIVERVGNENSRLVVIDDGSKDDTYEILRSLMVEHNKLIAMTKPNSGHGGTVLYGYRYAIKQGAKWVFQTDSDGQTNSDEFEQFWEKRYEYDAILGNRIERGDGRDRKFIENVVCALLFLFFGVMVKDANAPFRLMKSELLNKYIDKLPKDYNIPNIMFTVYFIHNKEKVLFLPISFKPREKGINSISLKKIVKIGWKAIGDFFKFRREIDA